MKYQIIYLCLAFTLVLGEDYCANMGQNQCEKCVDDAEFKDQKCQCKDGFLGVPNQNKCEKKQIPCLPGCKKCNSTTDCLECMEGAEFKEQKCQCKQGFSATSDKCEKISCPQGCKSCNTTIDCTECLMEGAEFKDQKCQCKEGFQVVPDQNKCEQKQILCLQGCKKCTTTTDCQECMMEGAEFRGNKCECKDGFEAKSDQNKCDKIICPQGCKSCKTSNDCQECEQGAELKDQKCQCKEGFYALPDKNRCWPCLPGCKLCNTGSDCSECLQKKTFNEKSKMCECPENQVLVDFRNECISIIFDILDANRIVEENFLQKSKKEYDKQFDFCNSNAIDAQLWVSDFLLTNEAGDKLKEETQKKIIGKSVMATYTHLASDKTNAVLYFNYKSFSPGNFTRDLKDAFYNISYDQGQIKNKNDQYIGFDIRDPESSYHFNLIINCGNSSQLSAKSIETLFDYYFGLFYICPPNCVDCSFKDNTVKCLKCIDQFQISDEGICKYKSSTNLCKKLEFPSHSEECVPIIKEDLLIYSINNKCYNCLDSRYEIENMETSKCNCNKGYYLNKRNLKCEKCEMYCEVCEFRKNNCLTCVQGEAYKDVQKKKCLKCEIIDCKECESDKLCKTCKDGYYLDEKDSQNRLCKACAIDNCLTCNKANYCETSKPGYLAKGGQVTNCETENCYTCSNEQLCLKCNESFVIKDNQCLKCNQGCKYCNIVADDKTQCQECLTGYYRDKSVFECKKCIENCEDCYRAAQCNKCSKGLQFKDESCKCKNTNEFYIKSQGKCEKCEESCDECENMEKCKKCKEGYFQQGNECKPCLLNCKTCYDEKTCTECKYGKIMSGNDKCGCMQGCENCKLIEGGEKCEKSEIGYYLSAIKPEECMDNCRKCEEKENCIECNEGYLKSSENKCTKCTDQNCSKCDELLKCNLCKKGYYLHGDQCMQCEDNCLECKQEKTNSKCLKCKQNLILDAGKCVESFCLKLKKDGKCEQCENHYYLGQDKKCKKCVDNCLKCDNNKCSSCLESFYLSDKLQCKKCPDFCVTCELEQKQVVCLTCQTDYSLNNNRLCSKQTSLFLIIIILVVLVGIYFIYTNRDCIFEKCTKKKGGYVKDPEEKDFELSSEEPRQQVKQKKIEKNHLDIFDDESFK